MNYIQCFPLALNKARVCLQRKEIHFIFPIKYYQAIVFQRGIKILQIFA